MKANTIISEKFAWKPSSSKESGRMIAGKKEGFHLPNSVTEDVGGFSLMPAYSAKQLRRIGKHQMVRRTRGMSRIAKNQWRIGPND